MIGQAADLAFTLCDGPYSRTCNVGRKKCYLWDTLHSPGFNFCELFIFLKSHTPV